jgi:lysophospholipase L1-like esterase
MLKKTKTSIGFIIIALLLVSALLAFLKTLSAQAEPVNNNQEDRLNYVALGDSITYGYKLPEGEKNFPTLLAENLDADYRNYAVVGQTSEELLTRLKNGEYNLENADVITIGIGSNDLLKPFQAVLAQQLEIDSGKNAVEQLFLKYYKNPVSLAKEIVPIKEQLIDNPVFNTAVKKFTSETFPEIIKEIKKQNPFAEIIVINIYNPYYNVKIPFIFNLGEICESYITEMNKIFENPEDFTVSDVYTYFKESGMTNVSLSLNEITEISIDPHPTAQGHMVIFSLINQLLQNREYNKNY